MKRIIVNLRSFLAYSITKTLKLTNTDSLEREFPHSGSLTSLVRSHQRKMTSQPCTVSTNVTDIQVYRNNGINVHNTGVQFSALVYHGRHNVMPRRTLTTLLKLQLTCKSAFSCSILYLYWLTSSLSKSLSWHTSSYSELLIPIATSPLLPSRKLAITLSLAWHGRKSTPQPTYSHARVGMRQKPFSLFLA